MTFQRVKRLNLNEPIKVAHLQEQDNQPTFHRAIVISTIIFRKVRKTLLLC